jgi:uracil-DNA glycosylase
MPSRCALDELTRRYLKQQIELGGSELVLGEGRGGAGGDSEKGGAMAAGGRKRNAARERGPDRAGGAGRREPAPSRAASSAGTASTPWLVGAPPIPGPGLVIEAPAVDLLAPAGPSWPSLEAIAHAVAGCRQCFLSEGRTNTVPGEGNPKAQLVLVGEGPGQTEDQTGRPFVGRAGELLNDILKAIGYAREEVFICNVVKCRPPQNRKPLPDEMKACLPYLGAQLDLIRPKVILALGATAAEALLKVKRSLSDLRGKVHSYRGVPLVVTYHPAALLRNPNWKKPTWDDVRIARQLVDR